METKIVFDDKANQEFLIFANELGMKLMGVENCKTLIGLSYESYVEEDIALVGIETPTTKSEKAWLDSLDMLGLEDLKSIPLEMAFWLHELGHLETSEDNENIDWYIYRTLVDRLETKDEMSYEDLISYHMTRVEYLATEWANDMVSSINKEEIETFSRLYKNVIKGITKK